ncbi:phage tail tape measure protein [Polaribacter sp. MSW13]|uniref:Phage tail tape measure protein n=1 Tax=Polaribacter marinus TaxID=2916838 RepID=A0A9X1VRR4_9FLAO|nr:phage tail tape measure protein [Polaribacter marinus]MCI2229585.1 phage tail tape measure protein [Polaribacter marinus]
MSSTRTEWILELVDRVTAPLKNVDRFAKLSQRSVAGVDRLLDRINLKSQRLSGNLKRMSIGALAFGALSLGSLQFEQGMARANTMAEVGAKQLALYSNQVRGIAEIVPIAKTQLSEGLYNTISAGVPKDNWITFLRDSSKASIAGNAELGLVVDATSSIIKAYGDQWENATKIQDRFQKTVQLGQIPSLQSLAAALPRVSAVSSDLKVSQEELLAVFATASGVMGKPAEVATQLNAVLSALSKPGAEAIKTATNLGVAFNANSISKAGGLKNYIDLLMPKIQAFSDKTGQTQQEIIGKLFGSQEAIKLVIGLGGNLAESFGQNTEKLNNSVGSVQSAFDIMNATTLSKLQIFRNTFGNMMDGVVMTLAPLFQVLLGVVTKVFSLIAAFTQAHPILSKFIIIGAALIGTTIFIGTAIALVSLRLDAMYLKLIRASLSSNAFTASMGKAALAGMGFLKTLWRISMQLAGQALGYALVGASMLGSFIVGLISATAAQWGLNVALNANPIGLIVIGIVAAVGAIALMIKYWTNIKKVIWSFTKFMWKISPFGWLTDLVDKIFPGFKAGVKVVFDYVKNLVFGFWETIKKVWENIKSFFGFGDDETAEINIKVNKTADGKIIPTTEDINPSSLLLTPTAKSTGGTGTTNGLSGGGSGGGKSITMTLDIKNYFNMAAGNWKESADEIADVVVGKINDRLRDAAIALE